jgi:hypothetical protein
MARVLLVAGVLLAVSACGGQSAFDSKYDECGVVLRWDGETYDGVDVEDAPALGSRLGGDARITCEGTSESEPVGVSALRGVDPALAVAALPNETYAGRVTIWVLRGSAEAHAAGFASCLGPDAPDVQYAVGDRAGTAYFTEDRTRDARRADWSVQLTSTGPRVALRTHGLLPQEADLVERCAD